MTMMTRMTATVIVIMSPIMPPAPVVVDRPSRESSSFLALRRAGGCTWISLPSMIYISVCNE